MAYSYVNYTANGATSNFTVPFPYIVKQDIHVSINEIQVDDADLSWVGDTVVHLPSAPVNGAIVKVWRSTNKEALSTIYSTPNVIDHRDWNRVLTQLLYTTQEAYDLGITPLSDLQEAIENLQNYVNQAAAHADAALLYKTAAELAKVAAEAARDLAQDYANLAGEIAEFDPNLYLKKSDNLTGIADPAAARTNIGALGTGDLPSDLLRYSAQSLTGPQKTQSLANIGAMPVGGGTMSGPLAVSGSITANTGEIASYGYTGSNSKGVYHFAQAGDRQLRYGVSGAYFEFVGAHVYSPAGRLLGTNDAASIVASLRWVYGGVYETGQLAPQQAAPLGANVMITGWTNDGSTLRVYGRYLQMQIAGTWYTVGAV